MATSLDELSRELNLSESGLRKRIKSLGINVEKGARGKWLLTDELAAALKQADHAMKNGAGEATIRRIIGFAPDQPRTPERTEHSGPRTESALNEHQAANAVTEDKTGDISPELQALHLALSTAHSGPSQSGEDSPKLLDLLADAHKRI